MSRALRNGTYRRQRAAVFDLANARGNQIFLHRLLINFLQQRRDFRFVGLDNFLQNFPWVFVARLDAFQIKNSKPAEFAHGDGEWDIDNAIHSAREDGNFQHQRLRVFAWQTEGNIYFIWVNRYPARNERDFVEFIERS